MNKCEACGSLIITAEDITALREECAGHVDPVGDRGISGVGETVLELRKFGTWSLYSSTMMECSNCKKHVPYHRYQYCPHCGSKNKM